MTHFFVSKKMVVTLFLIFLFISIGFSLPWCNIPGECDRLNSCRTSLIVTTLGENNISTNFTQLLDDCGKQTDLEINSIRILYQNETNSILIPVNYSNTSNITEVYFNATETRIGNVTYYMYFSPVENLILNPSFETGDFSNWDIDNNPINICSTELLLLTPNIFEDGNYYVKLRESCGMSSHPQYMPILKSNSKYIPNNVKKVDGKLSYDISIVSTGSGGTCQIDLINDINNLDNISITKVTRVGTGSSTEKINDFYIDLTDWAKGKNISYRLFASANFNSWSTLYADNLQINIHNKTEPTLTFTRTLITPPYSTLGTTEDFPSLSISLQSYSKKGNEIPIKIKNNGKARTYDLQISSDNGLFNQTYIEKLESNEEKMVNFKGEFEVGVHNLTININHDNQKNVGKTQRLIVYSDETVPEETSSVTFNDSGIFRYLTKNANYTFTNNLTEELDLSEAIVYENEFTSSECKDLANNLLNTQTLADRIIIDMGNLSVGTTKKIKCIFESTDAPSISEEEVEEQDLTKMSNMTFAFTRIPLFFNNPYSNNLTIIWDYTKTGFNNRTESETNGILTLINETTEIKYLKMNKTINLTVVEIKNHTNGKINPSNNYLETYGLFIINNDGDISFSNISFEHKNNTYLENITSMIKADNNTITENYLPVKLSINKSETEIGDLSGFNYPLNRLIKMNHSNLFHVYNLTFEYNKGNWETFNIYKCIYDNSSKCITSNSSNWEIKEHREENGKIKIENNKMSDLVYIISYKLKTSPFESSGGGGGGGEPSPIVEINITKRNENATGSINHFATSCEFTNSTKYKCVEIKINYGTNEIEKALIKFRINKPWFDNQNKTFDYVSLYRRANTWEKLPTKYDSEDKNYYYFISETLGFSTFVIVIENNLQIPEIVSKEINKTQEENFTITSDKEEIIEDNQIISTAGPTGLIIGSGNFLLGIFVLFLALTGFYIYQKRDSIPEIRAPEIPKIKMPKIKLPSVKTHKIRNEKIVYKKQKSIIKQENLPDILDNKKTGINRKEIEEATIDNKPLAVQRICKFIKEDGSKINYTITELSHLLNLSQVSVRKAVNRGIKLDVFEKYEHGKFKAYRLGKYGKKVANLETEIKTYSELETVIILIKKRDN